MNYKIICIEGPRIKGFSDLLEIYTSAIPENEQKTSHEVAGLLKRQDYKVLAVYRGEEVVAFSILYFSQRYPILLLEYMATREDCRNEGIGAKLFAKSLSMASGRMMLIEVDSEREDSKDNDLRVRRKNFYRRLGCKQVLGLDYLLPLKSQGKSSLMDMMVHINNTVGQISTLIFRYWLSDVYKNVYQCSPNDPRIEKMLAAVSDPVVLI